MTVKIEFLHDDSPSSPREDDNLGTLSCRQHRRYILGDEQFSGSVEDFVAQLPKGSLVIPVYIYEHGSIGISTTPFSCSFDSAQLGVIWASPSKLREEYGRLTTANIERATSVLKGEVNSYAMFVNGETYGIRIQRDGVDTDECWGYLGRNVFENGMSEQLEDDELPLLLEAAQRSDMEGTHLEMSNQLAARLAYRTRQAKALTRRRSI